MMIGRGATNLKVVILLRDADSFGVLAEHDFGSDDTYKVFKLPHTDSLSPSQMREFHGYLWSMIDSIDFSDYKFSVENFR